MYALATITMLLPLAGCNTNKGCPAGTEYTQMFGMYQPAGEKEASKYSFQFCIDPQGETTTAEVSTPGYVIPAEFLEGPEAQGALERLTQERSNRIGDIVPISE